MQALRRFPEGWTINPGSHKARFRVEPGVAEDTVTKAMHSKSLTCTHCEDERVFNKGVRDQKHSVGTMLPLPVWQCNIGLKNITRLCNGSAWNRHASPLAPNEDLFQVHVQIVERHAHFHQQFKVFGRNTDRHREDVHS